MPSEHSNRGAKRAREAREALGLDAAAPLDCLLTVVEEGAGLPVVVAALPDAVAGACHRRGEDALLWVNGRHPSTRQRFTLAHELAHAWCRHDGRLAVDTFETLGGRTTNPYEVQANAFAAELLVPRAAMRQLDLSGPTLEEVVLIAAHFGVSTIVVVYRLQQLGLASSARCDELQSEIEEGLDEAVAARLAPPRPPDRLAALEHLPYLSPALAGSHLEAGLQHRAPVDGRLAGAIDRLLG